MERVRSEWGDDLRIASGPEPGQVVIAIRDDMTDEWSQITVGTGDVDDVVRLLNDAYREADEALNRPRGLPPTVG